jgi:hypothetical protein
VIRRLAAGLALALVALAAAAPAHADDDIGFSSDGTHWATSLGGPLFPASTRWVPGDVEEASFYVRNQGPTDGKMIVNAATDDAQHLVSSGDLAIAARVGSGPWTALRAGDTRLLPAVLDIAQDATSRITVKVRYTPASTTGQTLASAFRLRILMFQGDVKGISVGHGNGHGNGHGGGVSGSSGLPNTGSPVAAWWLWLAAALVGSGLALVLPGRRKEVRDA